MTAGRVKMGTFVSPRLGAGGALRDAGRSARDAGGALRDAAFPAEAPDIRFSKHAATRLRSRGIELSQADLQELSDAVDRLESKNARESLLLLGEHAFIVGVPKRTVITALTRREAIGSIFTNIDSTLVLR